MELEIAGQTLHSIEANYSVELRFTGCFYVRIENQFRMTSESEVLKLDPEHDAPELTQERLKRLVGAEVVSATVENSGELVLSFAPATTLLVEPDEDYESWQVSGPKGLQLVCTPGGEIAEWSSEDD